MEQTRGYRGESHLEVRVEASTAGLPIPLPTTHTHTFPMSCKLRVSLNLTVMPQLMQSLWDTVSVNSYFTSHDLFKTSRSPDSDLISKIIHQNIIYDSYKREKP